MNLTTGANTTVRVGSSVRAEDFGDFYRAVHGHDPFPWQEDLTEQVLREGRWPTLVDVPTGLGKTSMLDIAVFVAAATADENGPHRVGRRRCLFVVDRRVVVDEATEHARGIAKALQDAEAGSLPTDLVSATGREVLARVAAGLRVLGGDGTGEVLPVTRMRGGTTWASAWADRPDRPGVVVATVDQVGSRLLFRGYGVSDRRRPIDAALVGTDALLLVDEAHLATALLTTATAAGARDRTVLPLPGLDIVQLTATARRHRSRGGQPENGLAAIAATAEPDATTSQPVEGTFPFDLGAHQAISEAHRRLDADKTLFLLATTSKVLPATLARTALTLAAHRSASGAAPVILVVCNTVDTARRVHSALEKSVTDTGGTTSADVQLLIGRSRPVDRHGLDSLVRQRYGIGAPRSERPAILVATQTVEVGINLDVDALVTESASWDALVQRLGRLNRLGRHQDRFPETTSALAVVIHDGQDDGPVYGRARQATWAHLSTLIEPIAEQEQIGRADLGVHGLGVSPAQCRALSAQVPAEMYMDLPGVPVLTTPILDHWVRTAPVLTPDPPIEEYLHGFSRTSASVAVAWREGLREAPSAIDLDDDGMDLAAQAANQILAALPIRAAEQVEIPLIAVRRWADGQRASAVADIEIADELEGTEKLDRAPFDLLAWREHVTRGGEWHWIHASELRPGNQVVVPTHRGGLDRYGWNPDYTGDVADGAEAAALDSGRLLLRLDHSLAERLSLPPAHAETVTKLVRSIVSVYRRPDGDEEEPDQGTETAAAHAGSTAATKLTLRLIDTLIGALHPDDADRQQPPSGESSLSSLLCDRSEQLMRILSRVKEHPQHLTCITLGKDPEDPFHEPTPEDTFQPQTVTLNWRPPPRQSTNQNLVLAAMDRDDDSAVSSSIGVTGTGRVTLEQHHTNVRRRAIDIAQRLRLPDDLIAVTGVAAGWHDLGKLEDRFQTMLHGGDSLEALVSANPLAKSGLDPDDRTAWQVARERSGLPRGARHEAWSAILIARYLSERSEPYPYDSDLLLHLVASHHGHARPLLPLVVDDDPRAVDAMIDGHAVQAWSADMIDLDHPGRFARLNERYGRWGLALLETIVRCADMTVSAEGS
jgi:CRISPR-associated endonuclease/helicase Cas3